MSRWCSVNCSHQHLSFHLLTVGIPQVYKQHWSRGKTDSGIKPRESTRRELAFWETQIGPIQQSTEPHPDWSVSYMPLKEHATLTFFIWQPFWQRQLNLPVLCYHTKIFLIPWRWCKSDTRALVLFETVSSCSVSVGDSFSGRWLGPPVLTQLYGLNVFCVL